MEHFSYLYFSQIQFYVELSEKKKEEKKDYTSDNFLSVKWLFSCIWNIFLLQALFSN